jgi:hypothetical protein
MRVKAIFRSASQVRPPAPASPDRGHRQGQGAKESPINWVFARAYFRLPQVAHDLALVAGLRLAGLEWVSRESLFTFVTDGIDSVLAQARAVARDKDVGIGGANVIRQSLATGLVEELRLRVAPVLLRVRKGLSDIFGNQIIELERISVVGSPYATHLFFMSAADRFQRWAPMPERHQTSP